MFRFVQEIFGLKEDPLRGSALSATHKASSKQALERIITDKAVADYGLYPNKNWVEKCMQIYTLSKHYDGIILCGHTCSGKVRLKSCSHAFSGLSLVVTLT
jgi:hypothetical protein